ncbi:Glycerol-3-phosphate dehydrogenase [Phytophthora nicotianae]|uniref:Glycerol-3-phosphate dehydrogenase n=1 Tax=Phytophthora nicotianae TaxID=4792 RepID=A0A0W8DSF8_PHYNI|nr:Glycerol-3-phosphate dehydrogenase [Phytophthora nicotianae]
MGAPAESVKAKMQMAGLQPELLDTPDAPLRPISSEPTGPASQSQVKVKDDPSYAKFFKLLSMGAPAESVKAKMKMAGLNPHLLDTPDATMPNANAPAEAAKATVKVKDDPDISIPELQGDMNRISDITESINVELAAQRLKNRIEEKEENDLFVESMTVFVDEASKDVTTLKKDLDDTLRLMRDIMLRFEKSTDEEEAAAPAPDTPLTPAVLSGAGEFFSIIYEFTMALTKADRENELKRIRDEKRLKQQELRAATPRRNAGDRAALTRFKGKTEATGTSNNPVTTADDSVKSGAEPETLTPNNATKTPETDAEKTKSSTSASEDQVVAEVGVEEKAVPELTGIPNTALKIPGIVKVSALPSVPASPLKKVVGGMPTGIPSPMKLKWTNSLASPTGKSANRVVPFDAASLNEIKSKLKTKHATNNEPQMRGSKPEVEGDGDNQDNNNNEPATPEKTLSEVEPSARVAVESDA